MPEALMFRGDTTTKVESGGVAMTLKRGGGGGTNDFAAYPKCYTLKLRHTGSPNLGGGEGALVSEEVSLTLATGQDQTLIDGWDVRRLMPVECNRLQGFPDGWDDITGEDPEGLLSRMPQGDDPNVARKVRRWCEGTPDGPRYKAMGNSMAVPVMEWIGRRIDAWDKGEIEYEPEAMPGL